MSYTKGGIPSTNCISNITAQHPIIWCIILTSRASITLSN
uniref:Uncharacterized protein n=1 Tax=Siphoviridae sp. ctNEy24 TaxID=2825466 RepID=A0A8S5U0J1_9CAUD|nr:MAG TPA: hypothetical protein [Siphoviridae sp. ctNEy24]